MINVRVQSLKVPIRSHSGFGHYAAIGFLCGHSTWLPDARHRAMSGDGQQLCVTGQSSCGNPDNGGCGVTGQAVAKAGAMSDDGQQLCVTGQYSCGTPENVGCGVTVEAVAKAVDTEQISAEAIDIHGSKVPIVEVAFNDNYWWSMPMELSAALYEIHEKGQDAIYTWNWGPGGRAGSWSPLGATTTINRYKIVFSERVQVNTDNGRKRSVRIVWVDPQDVEPQFTGGKPKRTHDEMVPE